MKVLIAPDSFKETLSANRVVAIIAEELSKNSQIETIICPLADGGEGTLDLLSKALGGELITIKTVDPLQQEIEASYSLNETLAIIELAQASGLTLVPKQKRNPLLTSTFGTGLLIKDAIKKGATTVLLTLGGSATNDGGAGIAHALGVTFKNQNQTSFLPTGGTLSDVKHIELPVSFPICVYIVCDVTNPLLGSSGASFVFAPQKGASKESVIELEKNMVDYLQLVTTFSKKDFNQKGLGAAGGTALSLVAFFDAKLISWIEFISKTLKLEEQIKQADVVITGEGSFDPQSLNGKVISEVIALCKQHEKPLYVICGSAQKMKLSHNIKVVALTDYFPIDECMQNTEDVLKQVISKIEF